ncbi:acyloxyacyl hydrolase [Pseudomonas flexibilis]|uniref:Lipid A deacylase n=1 Tax=Pseudomonas flexibilis TaxID=706570 RepID=A0A0B3BZU6_9PSED|nr:acyloxyacyl hydrolase [Pseudomonas flexibilis]KHO66209.1 hypothetical protein PT85_01125 [Pseudomonas flexibilis]SCY46089.1 lipid A 3-O-deacylase [Pseudomonas flexibilis]
MRNGLPLVAAFALAAATSPAAQAVDLTLSVGESHDSTTVVRIALESSFSRSWWQTSTGRLTGYWDAGYTWWEGDLTSDNHSLSLAPVFVYEFAGERLRPFIEVGIGVAVFADTQIEDRDLGSMFQFEDRIGVGLRFGQGHTLGLRAIHYSNAGIKNPNDGAEVYSLYYRLPL